MEKKMINKKIIIRITLWWGIIADLFEAIRMAIPRIFIFTTGITGKITNDFRFALLYGAPVMFGWAVLLFWADRKPVKRKGIFLCLIPVITGYFIVEIVGINMGILHLQNTFPTFILQTILLLLSITSYIIACKTEKE
jgi:hypothetical protein